MIVNNYGIDGFKFDAGDMGFYQPEALSKEPVTPNKQCELYAQFGLRFPLNEYRACWKMAGQPLVQRLRDKNHKWQEMDYTPVGFSNVKYPHLTSYAHELALSLVFNSGILHFADNVKTYRTQPEYVKTFLKKVPVVFDETHYIDGEPGKMIILASRKGNDWYVAGINGEQKSKEVTVLLPFIKQGQFQLNLITDGADSKSFANETRSFKPSESIQIKMLGKGGFVAVLSN